MWGYIQKISVRQVTECWFEVMLRLWEYATEGLSVRPQGCSEMTVQRGTSQSRGRQEGENRSAYPCVHREGEEFSRE